MKFRLPPDCLGLSLEGKSTPLAADGTIEAEDRAADTLASHGIVSVDDTEAPSTPRRKARQEESAMSSPIDLASLADCKAWLGLTSTTDDGLLAELITAISQAILADLGRPSLLPAMVTETLDGGCESVLPLRHWPVTRVTGLSVDGVAVAASLAPGQAGWVLEAADAAPPGTMQRLYLRASAFPPGVQNICVTYVAGYAVAGESATVPASAPFTLSTQAPYGAWALDAGVTGASAAYTVAGGVYTFTPVDAGASVALTYGYVPADLARAACEWVADRYVSRTRIGQSAKTLGGQETTSFIVKAMPDVVSRLVQPYRRVAR